MLMHYSSEALAFQNDELGNWLAEQYDELLKSFDAKEYNAKKKQNPIGKKIQDRLIERFGPVFTMDFTAGNYYATINDLSRNNQAFYYSWLGVQAGNESKKFIKALNDMSMNLKVDLKALKLSGSATEQGVAVAIDVPLSRKFKLTGRELAAITMHEIGHVFATCYLYTQGAATNLTMSYLHRTYSPLAKADAETAKTYVFARGKHDSLPKLVVDLKNPKVRAELSEISKKLYKDERLVDQMGVAIDDQAMYMVLVGNMDEIIRNETGSVGIAEYHAEGWADHFSVKHGLGRALVTGLEKLYGRNPERSVVGKGIVGRKEMSKAEIAADVFKLLFVGVTAASTVMLPGFFIMGSIALMSAILTGVDSDMNYTYGNMKVRYNKIRQMATEFLKDPNADPAEIKKYIADIDYIQAIADDMDDAVSRGMFQKFSKLLFWRKKAMGAVHVQMLMDEMGNNEIFLSAAKLAQTQGNTK